MTIDLSVSPSSMRIMNIFKRIKGVRENNQEVVATLSFASLDLPLHIKNI